MAFKPTLTLHITFSIGDQIRTGLFGNFPDLLTEMSFLVLGQMLYCGLGLCDFFPLLYSVIVTGRYALDFLL